ncbi:hypothetical protein [Oligoflexus tunisiensis]|uniref:hypothetical protein n=1 Tax=Oligoflexus tunisiensis TaxID=708132 RepID=UPI00114D049A|nr:hypothetical protein [Oligoflexus tunisiensis]
MKTLTLGLFFAGLSQVAPAAPLDILDQHGCDTKLEQLARDYLQANAVLVSIYEDQSPSGRRLDASTLKLCSSHDLDPGSWNLRRETGFCNEQGDRVEFYTYGNLWCDDEVVLGIKTMSLASATP